MTPTPRQLECLRAFVRCGSRKEAAHELGIAETTLRNNLAELYYRLGVEGHMAALRELGWLQVPEAA